MDLKSLAEWLDQMPIDPYFTYFHIVACTLYVRTDMGAGKLKDKGTKHRTKLLPIHVTLY